MSFELILPFLRPDRAAVAGRQHQRDHGQSRRLMVVRARREDAPRSAPFLSMPAKLRTGLEVIANQLGKKLDEDNPFTARAASGRKPPRGV